MYIPENWAKRGVGAGSAGPGRAHSQAPLLHHPFVCRPTRETSSRCLLGSGRYCMASEPTPTCELSTSRILSVSATSHILQTS
jgi:hypothetical protein